MSLGLWIFAAALLGQPAESLPAPALAEAAVAVEEAAGVEEEAAPVQAAPPYFQLKTSSSDGKLQIELSSAFSEGLASGFDSFTLSTRNKGKPRLLFVSIEAEFGGDADGTASSSRRVEVPTGQQSVELLLPVLPPEAARRPLRVRISGPGVLQEDTAYSRGNSRTNYVIGSSVALPLSKGQRRDKHWVQLDLTRLPLDWRAYLGFDLLMLTGAERAALSPAHWDALSIWVAQGGVLQIVREGQKQRQAQGLGLVIFSPRVDLDEGGRMNCDLTLEQLERFKSGASAFSRPTSLKAREPRADLCGQQVAYGYNLSSPAGLLSGFFILFFLLVGPLNLALCWKRRSRLLWSTPLISVLSAGALFGVVLLRDGVGGEGHRQLVRLFPGDGREFWLQEQATKTGLLLGGEGAQEVPAAAALELTHNASVQTQHQSTTGWRGLAPGRSDGAYSGSWWLSRSVQAQRITQVARSHRYLEREGERVRSNLDVPLAPLFVWEGEQLLWVERLEPGAEARLKPAQLDRLRALFQGPGVEPQLAALAALSSWPQGFIGQTPEGVGLIESRTDIDWQDRPSFVIGVPRIGGEDEGS